MFIPVLLCIFICVFTGVFQCMSVCLFQFYHVYILVCFAFFSVCLCVYSSSIMYIYLCILQFFQCMSVCLFQFYHVYLLVCFAFFGVCLCVYSSSIMYIYLCVLLSSLTAMFRSLFSFCFRSDVVVYHSQIFPPFCLAVHRGCLLWIHKALIESVTAHFRYLLSDGFLDGQ